MSSRIIHKRSLTEGSIPTTSSLNIGELAINVNDGKVFLRRSGSNNNDIVPIVTANTVTTGSITATSFTGSLSGTASWANNTLTASYLNTLNQDLTLTGSLTITNNLTILGSQSVQYITSSQLDISTNLITVNTSTPAVRFGGIAVRDSGSLATGLTGSLLWDSEHNVWIYSNPSGAAYDGGIVLMGPRNINGLGNEVGITTNTLAKGDGSHHMTSSQILDNGTTVTIPGNLSVGNTEVTGSLIVNDGAYNIIDTTTFSLADNASFQSIDWSNRVLYASDGATSHLDWSNPLFLQLPSITTSPITNVLGIDGSGRLYYTASSAIGGGGSGGDFVPSSWTGSATSQFAGTASLASTASFLQPGTYQITSSRAINALTASYFIGPGSATISDDGTNNLSIGANRVFITGSNTVIIRGDNGINLSGSTTVVGSLLPGSPYTNNTSSYNLGSPVAAWKDLYVSNGSVNFISGSTSASIGFNNGNITFSNAIVTIPTGSIVPTASFALTASFVPTASFALTASYIINSTSSVIGNGLSSSFNINHGFNTRNLHITVYESGSNGETVYPDIRRINENTASVVFANPPLSNEFIVYISI